MRFMIALVMMFVLFGSAAAADLGNNRIETKNTDHIGMNPGTPDGRQGGEMDIPFLIEGIPFSDTGNTGGMIDEYDVVCPYDSNSPDAWYSWTAAADMLVNIDLCGSEYDTKVYVLTDGAEHACNDDAYYDDICGYYVSLIEAMPVTAGATYMIAVDGYGGDSGDYILDISEFIVPPPCFLTCDGRPEGEPELMDGYEDTYNGGCNSPEYDNPFLDLTEAANDNGELTFCGISGWYNDNQTRDTDWMYVAVGEIGLIEWTLDAEYPVYGFLLGGYCDSGITVDDQITAGSCMPATMVIQGSPGNVIMLWVGPTEYHGPPGFVGHEFKYIGDFTGLYPPIAPVDKVSIDSIKSLYR